MGCTGSKKGDVVENNPLEFQHKEISDARPAKIRKEINDLYAIYQTKRDRLKPLLAEKYGIEAITNEQREALIAKSIKNEELVKQRKPLMDKTWERDADEIYKAFSKFNTDKTVIVNILCARTYWQISEISAIFQRKYGVTLISKVVNELTTVLGSLLTGSGTGLSKLLTYRILPQPDRDAALIKDCTDGMSLDNIGLIEVLSTRSNLELKKAIIQYNDTYKKDLYDAGAGRSLGFDPEPFTNILVNINAAQFESINEHYPNRQLVKDINSKLGGDFQMAVLSRCTNKYEYLANRIESALKGWSPDKETLCRVLGCLSRPDCVKVKLAYNRLGFKRTLDEAIRTILKGQTNYINACLMLISEDTYITPLGSDKEVEEEQVEVSREAERIANAEMVNYPPELFIQRGEQIMKDKRKSKFKFFSKGGKKKKSTKKNDDAKPEDGKEAEEEDGDQGEEEENAEEEQEEPPVLDPQVQEEDRILGFTWDGKGRFLDVAKLTSTFRELEYVENQVSLVLDRIQDENNELRGIFKTILKADFEMEAFIRIYTQQIRHISDFIRNRGEFKKEPSNSSK